MMLLQTEAVTWGVGGLVTVNTVLLLKLIFSAGQFVERVNAHERRITKLEEDGGCGAEDCPLHKRPAI